MLLQGQQGTQTLLSKLTVRVRSRFSRSRSFTSAVGILPEWVILNNQQSRSHKSSLWKEKVLTHCTASHHTWDNVRPIMSENPEERQNNPDYWKTRWSKGQTGFTKSEVHPMIIKHYSKLFPNDAPVRVFVPLCGKTLDMKWLADKGQSVVGLDVVPAALEQFFDEHKLSFTKEQLPGGAEGMLYKADEGKIQLYCFDMMKFDNSVGGTFDAIWDRASIVAIARGDVPTYVQNIKSLLKPGGLCLLETMDYDLKLMDDIPDSSTKPPPPHPMYEEEIKKLYEPECTVQLLDRQERKLADKDIHCLLFLLTKKA